MLFQFAKYHGKIPRALPTPVLRIKVPVLGASKVNNTGLQLLIERSKRGR